MVTGFMTESEIEREFSPHFKVKIADAKKRGGQVNDNFEHWYKQESKGHRHVFTYGHNEKLKLGNHYDCNLLVDEWFKWFLTTPASINPVTSPSGWYATRNSYGDRNVFSFDNRNTFAYFMAATPFQEPVVARRVVITRQAPLLVPVYNASAAKEESPSAGSNLDRIVIEDLKGMEPDLVKVKFDDMDEKDLFGCTVVRKEPLKISNIPEENIIGIPKERLQENNFEINICHSGFWLLIREDNLKSGDHLLSFESTSKNYEVKSKTLISVLA
jgi:hypothetical protein